MFWTTCIIDMTSTTIRYKCLLCRCWKCEYIYIWKDFVSYCVVWIRHIYIKIFRKNPKMYIYFDFFFMFRTQAKFYLLKIDDISRFCRLPQFSRKRWRANDSSSAEVQPFMDEIFSKGMKCNIQIRWIWCQSVHLLWGSKTW